MEDIIQYLILFAVVLVFMTKKAKKEVAEGPSDLPDGSYDVEAGPDTTDYTIDVGETPACPPRYTPPASPTPPAPIRPTDTDEPTSEYAIHSAEEARKAIIWSEILHRKY
ncbi:MAG: hypothetical protein ACI37U_06510 [Bacteroides sp.]